MVDDEMDADEAATVDQTTTSSLTTVATSQPGEAFRWTVDETVIVEAVLPDSFRPSPQRRELSDTDEANGLFVLESWVYGDSPTFATLSVQRLPVNAPHLQSSDQVVRSSSGIDWMLTVADETDPRPELVLAYATADGFLIHASGTAEAVSEIIDGLAVTAVPLDNVRGDG